MKNQRLFFDRVDARPLNFHRYIQHDPEKRQTPFLVTVALRLNRAESRLAPSRSGRGNEALLS